MGVDPAERAEKERLADEDASIVFIQKLRAVGVLQYEGLLPAWNVPVKLNLAAPLPPPPQGPPDKPPASRKKTKSYDERLFGRLPKREAR